MVHFFCFPPLHALFTLFRSFFLHVFLSLSAAQSFGDGAEAKTTGSHCGGTAPISRWRAWAVELGLDEINGLVVLVPVLPASPRPCQLWRGVWSGAQVGMCGSASFMGRRPRVHRVARCAKRCVQAHSMHAARNSGGHRESARSSDADDGEDAEADIATGRGLLGLGLGHGWLGLDLDGAELVVPSEDAVVLQEWEGGLTRMSTRRRRAV